MKVNGSQPHAPIERVVGTDAREGMRRTSSAVSDVRQHVEVSSIGRKLAAARAPEVPDEARIAELRERIAKGTLCIDPDRIAAAMLREER